jgi:hypothetical protein
MDSIAFPWLKHLPDDEQVECLRELKKILSQGSGSWEFRLNSLDEALISWKSTAEVYADSETLAALTAKVRQDVLTAFEVDENYASTRSTALTPSEEAQTKTEITEYLERMYGVGEMPLTVGPAPRLLDCGLCYEEDGEEVHPHPECTWEIPCPRCGKRVETWFDRSLCPEPCGSMHNRCTDCGNIVDHCPIESARAQARYKPGSVITQGIGPGSWRWEVVDVLNTCYRVRTLTGSTSGSPTYSTWEFGLCEDATVLEWQKDGREGVIDAEGNSSIPEEAKTDGD